MFLASIFIFDSEEVGASSLVVLVATTSVFVEEVLFTPCHTQQKQRPKQYTPK